MYNPLLFLEYTDIIPTDFDNKVARVCFIAIHNLYEEGATAGTTEESSEITSKSEEEKSNTESENSTSESSENHHNHNDAHHSSVLLYQACAWHWSFLLFWPLFNHFSTQCP